MARMKTGKTEVKSAGPADVAERAGCSVFTVQRVYNRPHTVSVKTRDLILAAANELGYTPNVLGRALRTGKVSTAALVMLARRTSHLLGDTFTAFYETLTSGGYDLTLSIIPEHAAPIEWISKLVRSGRCGGLAIHLERLSPQALLELQRLNVPIVLLYTQLQKKESSRKVHSVGFDNKAGLRQAVMHLIGLGHHRIAYFGGTPGWPDTHARELGFRSALQAAGMKPREPWIVPCDFKQFERSAFTAFEKVLSGGRSKPPTAIVCASDKLARATIEAARRHDLSVPQDISVTGFDDDDWSAYHVPPLTTVAFPRQNIAESAAQMLMHQFAGNSAPVRNLVLPTTLIVRDSTAAPAGTRRIVSTTRTPG
ncbi:MAG: LacI family DNA-binding transcriptional regulator [Candidatus Sumerlaeaceae bacterium]